MGIWWFWFFLFEGMGGIRGGADGENVVVRERAVVESLVDFRRRVSGDGISIGGFRAGMCHGGLERLGF